MDNKLATLVAIDRKRLLRDYSSHLRASLEKGYMSCDEYNEEVRALYDLVRGAKIREKRMIDPDYFGHREFVDLQPMPNYSGLYILEGTIFPYVVDDFGVLRQVDIRHHVFFNGKENPVRWPLRHSPETFQINFTCEVSP